MRRSCLAVLLLLPLFIIVLLAPARGAIAQATLEVISSVPAPMEMFGRSGWQPSMVGCGTDETITTYLQLRHEIVKFGLNGAVPVRIDTAHLLGPARIVDRVLRSGPEWRTLCYGGQGDAT
jgi:hypothetical protein